MSSKFNICFFNSQLVIKKTDMICDFISEHETLSHQCSDKHLIISDGYRHVSSPHLTLGEKNIYSHVTSSQTLPFLHQSFEFVETTPILVSVQCFLVFTDLLPAKQMSKWFFISSVLTSLLTIPFSLLINKLTMLKFLSDSEQTCY